MHRSPLLIKVFSGNETIGHMSTADFRDYMNGSSVAFIEELVADFNAGKIGSGEPERAEIVINPALARRTT